MTGRPGHRDVWASEPGRQSGRAGRRRRPQRGRRRWTAVAGLAGLVLLAMGVAAVAFVMMAPPLDAVRDRLVREVEARTGRTLTVAGEMSVSLYPRVVVSLAGIAIPPREGMDGAPILTVPSIEAEVSLWSLLTRRPRIERLTLQRPTINLAVDAEGRRSWERAASVMAARRATSSKGAADDDGAAPTAPPQQRGRGSRRPPPIAVRVVNGTVRYSDGRSGVRHEIGGLDLDLTSHRRASSFEGSFVWQALPFRIAGSVSPPAAPGDEPAQVVIKLAGAPLEATYRGTLSLQDRPAAKGTLTVTHLIHDDWRIGPGTIGVSVAAGLVTLTPQDVALYEGRANGSLSLDTTGPVPAISTDLKLTDVAVLPLLKDAAGATWLEGRGAITLALKAQGSSEKQLLETLRGRVEVNVAEGTVTGFDVDRTMRELRHGRFGEIAPRRKDRTPFTALAGTFDIADGIAANRDLRLVSAHVQLKGEGQIELVPRRIDYTLHTTIEGGPSDDAAVVRIGTLKLPIHITGPLDRPKFAIKGQEELTDAIGRIGRNLRSPEVQDAIEGLLGGDDGKRVDPQDLLDKLFR